VGLSTKRLGTLSALNTECFRFLGKLSLVNLEGGGTAFPP
jgi:hypothetical protein